MNRGPEHRVWAEVYLDRVAHNLRQIQDHVPPDTGLMPVVKADAYGHGAVQIAQVCIQEGASMFAIANTEEARQLRSAGFDQPMLILGEVVPAEIPDLVKHRIRPSIQTGKLAERIGREARDHQEPLPVHLAVDTGMSRLGASQEQATDLAGQIVDHRWLKLEGVSTHLSSAYDPDGGSYSYGQLEAFREVVEDLKSEGIKPDMIHVANSGGVFSYRESHFDLVRPGITIYGISPGRLSERALDLQPALEWRTKLVHIKNVPAGRPIGYGRSYRVTEDSRVGVLSVGYHDGYQFQLSNNAEVIIRGHRCPVIGRVTMDYVMVDLENVPDADPGDIVTLLGRDESEQINASELSERAGTIPYEMICSIGNRVKRIYKTSINPPGAEAFEE